MLQTLYYHLARLFRLLPKTTNVSWLDMKAIFFVPINNHYVCDDLINISRQQREPALYQWLNDLDNGAVFFDVGTSYGQESVLASSLADRGIRVFGFDCSLYQSHFCALNRQINNNRFTFTFAAVDEISGKLITITSNSDTHIPALHKKNVPYSYEVMTISLDDFARLNDVMPTHIKIDIDGAEHNVLKGAKHILQSQSIQDVFIEIDHDNPAVIDVMTAYGFAIKWRNDKKHNSEILFTKSG